MGMLDAASMLDQVEVISVLPADPNTVQCPWRQDVWGPATADQLMRKLV